MASRIPWECRVRCAELRDEARVVRRRRDCHPRPDVDDLLDHNGAEQLHHDAADEHLLAQVVGEQQHQVVRVHAVHGDEQHRRQRQQHDARQAAFARERLDLTPDLERSRIRRPILSRISARSPPVCLCRMTAVAKNLRSRFGTRSVRFSSASSIGHAEVLLLERAVELLADRRRHLVAHQVHAGAEAVTGPERPGDQLQRLGQLSWRTSSAGSSASSPARANGMKTKIAEHDRRELHRQPAVPSARRSR